MGSRWRSLPWLSPGLVRPRRSGHRFLPASRTPSVLSGLTNPTVVRFAPDGRVFVAEKSGLIKVFDNLSDTTPTTFADLRTKVHNFWDRGLLGMALDPSFPTDPYVYVLYTYDAADRPATAPRVGRRLPDAARAPTDRRLRRQRPAVAAHGLGRRDDRRRAGPHRGLVPAVPEPLDRRRSQFGADGALYVSGGDGASFNFADYGPGRQPRSNPCGDPPTASAAPRAAADRRGRRAAEPGPADAVRPGRRSTARSSASTPHGRRRGRTTRSPAAPTRTPAGSSPTGCATRSGSRSGPARTSSGSATSAGASWEEIDRLTNPHRRRDELRLALLRGRRPAQRVRQRRPQHLREPVRPAAERRDGARCYTYNHHGQGRYRRDVPDRQLV